eukprot:gene1518-biopygen9365
MHPVMFRGAGFWSRWRSSGGPGFRRRSADTAAHGRDREPLPAHSRAADLSAVRPVSRHVYCDGLPEPRCSAGQSKRERMGNKGRARVEQGGGTAQKPSDGRAHGMMGGGGQAHASAWRSSFYDCCVHFAWCAGARLDTCCTNMVVDYANRCDRGSRHARLLYAGRFLGERAFQARPEQSVVGGRGERAAASPPPPTGAPAAARRSLAAAATHFAPSRALCRASWYAAKLPHQRRFEPSAGIGAVHAFSTDCTTCGLPPTFGQRVPHPHKSKKLAQDPGRERAGASVYSSCICGTHWVPSTTPLPSGGLFMPLETPVEGHTANDTCPGAGSRILLQFACFCESGGLTAAPDDTGNAIFVDTPGCHPPHPFRGAGCSRTCEPEALYGNRYAYLPLESMGKAQVHCSSRQEDSQNEDVQTLGWELKIPFFVHTRVYHRWDPLRASAGIPLAAVRFSSHFWWGFDPGNAPKSVKNEPPAAPTAPRTQTVAPQGSGAAGTVEGGGLQGGSAQNSWSFPIPIYWQTYRRFASKVVKEKLRGAAI